MPEGTTALPKAPRVSSSSGILLRKAAAPAVLLFCNPSAPRLQQHFEFPFSLVCPHRLIPLPSSTASISLQQCWLKSVVLHLPLQALGLQAACRPGACPDHSPGVTPFTPSSLSCHAATGTRAGRRQLLDPAPPLQPQHPICLVLRAIRQLSDTISGN